MEQWKETVNLEGIYEASPSGQVTGGFKFKFKEDEIDKSRF